LYLSLVVVVVVVVIYFGRLRRQRRPASEEGIWVRMLSLLFSASAHTNKLTLSLLILEEGS
jgi:hypothetical protein